MLFLSASVRRGYISLLVTHAVTNTRKGGEALAHSLLVTHAATFAGKGSEALAHSLATGDCFFLI